MKKWNLVIDVAKCFNCNNCTLACHDEYHDNEFPGVAHGMPKQGQNWFRIAQRETGAVPLLKEACAQVCVYGHLHGKDHKYGFQGTADGIRYYLASVDAIDFQPIPIEFP